MNGFTNDLRSEVSSGALHLQHFRMRAIAKYLRGRVVVNLDYFGLEQFADLFFVG